MDVVRRISLLVSGGLLTVVALIGSIRGRQALHDGTATQLAASTRYFDSTIVLARNARPQGVRGDALAIALTYLERLRLGLASPFLLVDEALADPRLDYATHSRVAWALLGRLQRGTLGEIYERGQELEGGLTRAEELFRLACNGGSAAGCLNLGLVAASRDDKKHAAELFERSCTDGWTPGCHRLAMAFDQGEGVLQDLNRAIALYEEACANKYADSCVAAGMLFMTGQRVERDVARATRHFGTAIKTYDESCQAGNDGDCKERDKLRTRIAILAASQQP